MRTCENQRIKGWFYLPAHPDDRVPGILTWTPDEGAHLELIGGFSPPPTYRRSEGGGWHSDQVVGDVPEGTIYGVSVSGKQLSLWDANRGRYTAEGFSGTVSEEFWHCSWACIGAHVASVRENVLTNIRVAIDNLYYLVGDQRFCPPRWVTIDGVDDPGVQKENGTLLTPYALPVIGGRHTDLHHGAIDTVGYRIGTLATRPWRSDATEAMPDLKLQMMTANQRRGPVIELETSAWARIELSGNTSGSAASFIDHTGALLGLLKLATFDAAGFEWIGADTVDGEGVSILCRIGPRARPEEAAAVGEIIFTLDDVALDDYLRSWQRMTEASEQAQYAWNVVTGLIGHAPKMVEERVSQVLAAAEGFHHWCLGVANGTLRERLSDLHDRLDRELKDMLHIDINKWLGWAVWARNHVAHGGSDRHRRLDDYLQLSALADSVQLITYLAVLKEFGVPLSKILEALGSHPRLRVMVASCTELDLLPEAAC